MRSTSARAGRLDLGVGGQEGQHGGHVRRQHGRTLGHAGHRVVTGGHQHLLGVRVGGQDGAGSGLGRCGVGRAGGDQSGNGRLDRCHGQRDPDEAGRTDEDLLRGQVQCRSGQLAHPLGVGAPLGTGRRIGITAVDHHRCRPATGSRQVLAADLHRGCRRPVGGERGRRGGGPAVGRRHEREVRVTRLLDPGGQAGGDEPGRGRDAHGNSPAWGSPSPSGQPSAMLAHCTAWPAAPLTRLSRASEGHEPARPRVDTGGHVHRIGPTGGLRRRWLVDDRHEGLVVVASPQHIERFRAS